MSGVGGIGGSNPFYPEEQRIGSSSYWDGHITGDIQKDFQTAKTVLQNLIVLFNIGTPGDREIFDLLGNFLDEIQRHLERLPFADTRMSLFSAINNIRYAAQAYWDNKYPRLDETKILLAEAMKYLDRAIENYKPR